MLDGGAVEGEGAGDVAAVETEHDGDAYTDTPYRTTTAVTAGNALGQGTTSTTVIDPNNKRS